jgi:PAS domain S-box-containing protein
MRLLGAFAAHLAAGCLGYFFTNAHHFVAFGWPAIGVGAALVVCWGRSIWPALLASSVLVHFVIFGEGFTASALFVTADLTEIYVAAALLCRRCSWDRGFHRITQLQDVLIAGLVGPLLSLPLYFLGLRVLPVDLANGVAEIPGIAFLWIRSASGFFAVAPVILCWISRPQKWWGPSWRESTLVVIGGLFLCVVAYTNWIIPRPHPFWFALIPMAAVFWCAVRCGVFLTAHASLILLASTSFAASAEIALFDGVQSPEVQNMTWLILDLFSICALSLAILSSRVLSKMHSEQATRQRLELLVRHSPIALIEVDIEQKVEVWNDKATELFGFTEDHAVGRSITELLFPSDQRVEARQHWQSFIAEAEGSRKSFSHHNLTASGEVILCDWYGSLIRDVHHQVCGVVCLVINVSQREQADVALQESEQRLSNIADVLPQMICYYDKDLVRQRSNLAYQQAFEGLEPLQPTPLTELVSEEDLVQCIRRSEQALAGKTTRFIEELEMADGALHSVDRILLPDFANDGQVRGFFSVATDISAFLSAQDERLALETQVLQAQKIESLGKLAGRLAHEFNNRLFGIIGHADIVMHDLPADHSGHLALGKVLEIGREASDLCRQMFVFSGHGSGIKAPVDCGAMVTEMRRLLELSLPNHLRLTTQNDSRIPPVQADEAQIRQALMNLVQNAAEASEGMRNDIQVSVRLVQRGAVEFTESFLVSDQPDQELVAISVSDDGGGMTPEVQSRIFDPFFSTRSGAKGLGLAGVIGIMHGHGGALLVRSEIEIGTTISVFLPVIGELKNPQPKALSKLKK